MTAVQMARGHSERGETLLEIIISIAVFGVASTAIFGLAGTSTLVSDINRKQSTASRLLESFAEYMQDEASVPYAACPANSTKYDDDRAAFVALLQNSSSPLYEPGAASFVFTLDLSTGIPAALGSDPSVTFPDPSTAAACETATDEGIQRLTLTVSSSDGRAAESVQTVKWQR